MKTLSQQIIQFFSGLFFVVVSSSAFGSGLDAGTTKADGSVDMKAVDKNGQAITCYADDDRSWELSKTRKTLHIGIEGEGHLKKVSSRKVTSDSASYTTADGTLLISATGSTWTEANGEPEEISCELNAQPAGLSAASIKQVQAAFDALAEENNDDLRAPAGSTALKPSELKGAALAFYKKAQKSLPEDVDGLHAYTIQVAGLNTIAILVDNEGNGSLAVFTAAGDLISQRDFSESEDLGWN